MFKTAILKAFISGLFNDLLMTTKGKVFFNGHVTVKDVKQSQVITRIDIKDGYSYTVTVQRNLPQ